MFEEQCRINAREMEIERNTKNIATEIRRRKFVERDLEERVKILEHWVQVLRPKKRLNLP